MTSDRELFLKHLLRVEYEMSTAPGSPIKDLVISKYPTFDDAADALAFRMDSLLEVLGDLEEDGADEIDQIRQQLKDALDRLEDLER